MKYFSKIVPILVVILVLLNYLGIKDYASAQTNLQPIGCLDSPNASAVKGQIAVSGWFLDESGVSAIDVLVDGAVAGQASYGDTRQDVHNAYPGYTNGAKSGFHYTLDTGKYSDGQHTITIKETSVNGSSTTLPSRTITIANVIGYLDNPVSGKTLIGKNSTVSGWLLDESGVTSIDVLVDGVAAGQATYGDSRQDVHNAFPGYSNSATSGFHYTLDTTKYSDGQHAVAIKETSANGRVTTLPPSTITIDNVIGYVDNPVSGKTLRGKNTNVSGWLLDEGGVASIDVLVDGAPAGQATYGDVRQDVGNAFPGYTNSGKSGYHYTLDTTKYSDGQHSVTIKETGVNGSVTTLSPSTISIDNVIGYVDNPVSGKTLSGTNSKVSGWFLDGNGVANIDVLVDGAVAGQAVYGDARPDVKNAFPDFNNGNSGYHFALDTTKYNDGQHTVTIKETDTNGHVTTLPDSSINIANVIGYLDNPVSGTTLKGTKTVSGWILDGSGVANIDVLVDGTVVGQATYGDARADVKNAFPDFNNGNSGYHFALDTTQFSDGQHTVAIRETGNNGHVTTLSSSVVFKQSSGIIFLDPGHGGSDPGATSSGVRESDLNLAVAKKVQTILLSRGYTVYMSRTTDTFIPLLQRSQMANDIHADIFVSIHHNSTSSASTTTSGIESYFYKYDPAYPSQINAGMDTNPDRIAKSMTLASVIQGKLVSYTGAVDHGTAGETYSVVRESAMPATLLELGYINNSAERARLVSDAYQNTEANAIADGIVQYFKTN